MTNNNIPEYYDVATLNEKIRIAKQGLQAIIDQSPDISSNRKIAETTIEHMDNCEEIID